MEHVEHQMQMMKGKSNNVTQELKIYDKMEHIPVRDHLYLNYDKEFVKLLYQKEKVLFSDWVQLTSGWLQMFQKKRKLVVTTEQIIQCNGKNGEVR